MFHLPLIGMGVSALAGVVVAIGVTVGAVPASVNHVSTPKGPIAVYGAR
jgi:hypothetical protein